MRLDDYRTSDNVSDQRGQRFGGGGGGFGGGGMGLIIGLVASRFGIGGVLLLLAGAWLFGMFDTGGGAPAGRQPAAQGGATAAEACTVDPVSRFSCQVLASTEDSWARVFSANGQTYQPPGLTFYGGTGRSGCGVAQAAMGPFYCPSDNNIYLDTSFFAELQNRFGAAGDFAQAYVIAHEVGHHIQALTGVLDDVGARQRRLPAAQGNALQVRVELQADCYAGVWAGLNRERLEPGDIEEGMRAAEAIGDDAIQNRSQGRVVPESFTHGTSEQRMAWLRRGIEAANPAACDTFSGAV